MSSTIRGSDNFDSQGIVEGTATAWVNFNGTGTVAIRDSYNVSSITDNGVGDYTVNFDSTMANANYSASYTGTANGSGDGRTLHNIYGSAETGVGVIMSTTQLRLQSYVHTASINTARDNFTGCVIIHGGN